MELDDQSSDSADQVFLTDTLNAMCPVYMAMGMSYDDYWNGDPYMAKYYREAHKQRVKNENSMLYLQAQYFYEVMGCMASLYDPFGKRRKAEKFRDRPYDLFPEDVEATREREERERYESMRERLKAFAESHNKQMKKQQK